MLFMIRILDRLLTVAAAIIVAATAIITCIAVFFRSVLHSSLPWPEEVTGYALVLTSFIGACLAVRDNSHIGFDLLVDMLPPSSKRALQTFTDIVVIGFFMLLVYQSTQMLSVVGNTPLQTIEMIPVGVFMVAMPICGAGVILALSLRIAERWRDTA
jgi:TRAP-type C4-dicarboxylate transport system permease small subunit